MNKRDFSERFENKEINRVSDFYKKIKIEISPEEKKQLEIKHKQDEIKRHQDVINERQRKEQETKKELDKIMMIIEQNKDLGFFIFDFGLIPDGIVQILTKSGLKVVVQRHDTLTSFRSTFHRNSIIVYWKEFDDEIMKKIENNNLIKKNKEARQFESED